MIAVELNHEAKRLGLDFGAAKASKEGNFTPDKCRIRWSYLHLKVRYSFWLIMLRESRELQSSTIRKKLMKLNRQLQTHQRKIKLQIIRHLLRNMSRLICLSLNRQARSHKFKVSPPNLANLSNWASSRKKFQNKCQK
jgi:hypothetical protein